MREILGTSVPFFKVQGCGNDFVAIDNRSLGVPRDRMPDWARAVCKRAFGVYADGIFFLADADEGSGLDYRWDFYNSDGSRAEMCGNASRCVGRLAYLLGLAQENHVFGTDAGPIKVRVFPGTEQVKVQLTPPEKLALNLSLLAQGRPMDVHFVEEGVPHAVVFVEDAPAMDVFTVGRALRNHEHFAPAGTNVNFVQLKGDGTGLLRTYERGVEDETYACGTGAAASLVVANALGLAGDRLELTTSGGEVLTVSLDDSGVYLQGAAQITFSGDLYLDALGLSL